MCSNSFGIQSKHNYNNLLCDFFSSKYKNKLSDKYFINVLNTTAILSNTILQISSNEYNNKNKYTNLH